MEPVRELQFESAIVTGGCDLSRIKWLSYLRHVIMLSVDRIIQQMCWMDRMEQWWNDTDRGN